MATTEPVPRFNEQPPATRAPMDTPNILDAVPLPATLLASVEPLQGLAYPEVVYGSNNVVESRRVVDMDQLRREVEAALAIVAVEFGPSPQCGTVQGLASILVYSWKTMSQLVNATLRSPQRSDCTLKPMLHFLKLLLHTLRNLPQEYHYKGVAYRIEKGVHPEFAKRYKPQRKVAFYGFSSCTTKLDVLKKLVVGSGPRTIFELEVTRGYRIEAFTNLLGGNLEEILLEPCATFEVRSSQIYSEPSQRAVLMAANSWSDTMEGLHEVKAAQVVSVYELLNWKSAEPQPPPVNDDVKDADTNGGEGGIVVGNVVSINLSTVRIGEFLGKGISGSVYRVRDLRSGNFIAVKDVILACSGGDLRSPQYAHLSPQHKNLTREVLMCSTLKHPNVVTYFDTFNTREGVAICMEYMPGGNIWKILGERGCLSEAEVRKYLRDVLQGLQYMHSMNCIHRDIKGGNILLTADGVAKLADFGCSKLVDHMSTSACLSGNNSYVGTEAWMSPEVCMGGTSVTTAADIWSVGCFVVEMATAEHPWKSVLASDPTLSERDLKRLIGLGDTTPGVPAALQASDAARSFLLDGCFLKDPEARWTATQLLAHPWLSGASPPVSSSAAQSTSPSFSSSTSVSRAGDGGGAVTCSSAVVGSESAAPQVRTVAQPPPVLQPLSSPPLALTEQDRENIAQIVEICNVDESTAANVYLAESRSVEGAINVIVGLDRAGGCGVSSSVPHTSATPASVQENDSRNASSAAIAQFNIGCLYDRGDGMPQDDKLAVEYFEKAANGGVSAAMFNLGNMHRQGRGVPKDEKAAVSWYERAAQLGHVQAQGVLAGMYDVGRGVPQNDERAAYWYERAAEQGDSTAQFNVGNMYSRGRGVAQDLKKAAYWWERAAMGQVQGQQKRPS